MVVLLIINLLLCLTLSQQLNCSGYKECDCEYKSDYIAFECSKTIDNRSLSATCISNTSKLKLPDFSSLNLTNLTLIECIEKPYFNQLMRLLPIPGVVRFAGHPSNLKWRMDELPKATIKSLTVTSYEIGGELLAAADKLQELSITFCSIKLRAGFFNSSNNLKKIVLSHNEITVIPRTLFRSVAKVNEIDLSFNNLVLLLGNPFQSLRHLKKLDLQRNNLTLLIDNMLLNLVNLEILNLRGNNIRYISSNALFVHEYFGRLNVIDLSYNNLTLWEHDDTVNVTPFSSVYREPHRLQLLDLQGNKIRRFLHEWMRFPCADVLDLRHNNITEIDLPRLQRVFALDKTLNLDDDVDLYADPATLRRYKNTVFLKGNLVATDLKLRHLAAYYNFINSDAALTNVFDLNKLVCIKHRTRKEVYSCKLGGNSAGICPGNCTCFVRPWERIFVVECAGKGFYKAPRLKLPHFFDVEINLSQNLLTRGPQPADGYDNVIRLYLSGNRITDLMWIPPKIEALKIDNNNIEALNKQVLTNIRLAKHIELHHNPWLCNCEAFNLINLLKLLQPSGKVNLEQVLCSNSSVELITLNYNEVCNVYKRLELTVLLVVLAMTLAIIAALCYKYREEIRIILSVHDLLVKFRNASKIRDAFICYTYEDEEFLLNSLLPPLESGFNPYIIGLHFRDWVAGAFITDQIARSIEEARRTIIVLTPQFLRSKWGITEFRMAHDSAMQGLSKVIIILCEDINFEEIPDKTLKKYMATRSYIRWDDENFWIKLKSALPNVSDRLFIMSYKHLLEKENLIRNE